MELTKFKFWTLGELVMLITSAVCFWLSFVYGQMTMNTACLLSIGVAIICAVESEQRNAD